MNYRSFPSIARQIFWSVCLCLTFILFPSPSYALNLVSQPIHLDELNLQNIPHPQQFEGKWVIDMAGIIDSNTEVNLNQMISDWSQKTGDEIFIVTVTKTSPAPTPQVFTRKLFNYWEMGNNSQHQNILFLISVGDRRVEIKTGYRIQGMISDFILREIIQSDIIPKFKQANFQAGILAGTKSLLIKLEERQSTTIKPLPISAFMPLVLFALLFIVIVLFWLKYILSPKKMIDEISYEVKQTELILEERRLKKRSDDGGGNDSGGNDGGGNDSGGNGGGSDGGGSW